ncbi:hypothetical protein BKA70DRAFT_1238415 [Coprinopsis sp. MPI-PUGE-AT-0042]|nr:hypothetical protein BKA70DRAFT_1238415 [Coprinopsis sp. MPI-PUGE-AT-0042]
MTTLAWAITFVWVVMAIRSHAQSDANTAAGIDDTPITVDPNAPADAATTNLAIDVAAPSFSEYDIDVQNNHGSTGTDDSPQLLRLCLAVSINTDTFMSESSPPTTESPTIQSSSAIPVPSSDSPTTSQLNTGVIVGIAVGALALAIVLGRLFFLFCWRRRRISVRAAGGRKRQKDSDGRLEVVPFTTVVVQGPLEWLSRLGRAAAPAERNCTLQNNALSSGQSKGCASRRGW